MKVMDFDQEELQIKKDIEKAKASLNAVEDLSNLPDKNQGEEKITGKDVAKEVLSVILNILICFAVVFLITHYVGQRTVVSGSSMEDTLSDGDNLIVDKISYRLGDPERFDVVVFPYKYEEDTYYIKRVIGLPGETVYIDGNGNIYINGEILEEDFGTEVILSAGDASNEITLDTDEYFVLGDNRNNSTDSRFSNVGNIKGDDIVGRAWLRVYPFNEFGLVENIK